MTIDEIKDYVKDYFAKHGYRTFEDGDTHSDAHNHYLDKTAIRYQYFGERMFNIYKKNLNNCLLRGDKWFLLEMVNPQKAMMTNNTHEALAGALDNADTKLWTSAYDFYDYIGHDKFGILGNWLDKNRDSLLRYEYDMV